MIGQISVVSPPLYTCASASVVDQWRLSTGLFDKYGNGLMSVFGLYGLSTLTMNHRREKKAYLYSEVTRRQLSSSLAGLL
ncbi:hypothetical protein T11_6403 [Trichinella zimbabwensis]|uniref:Uncharacterized protein n=1 Tax=Trichinella zimbabwensis TaxID=268475 RepID=A0A0V1HV65_9BILA|nr:hypothetical protein T11_6403 [Trichinella zimbabwensis]